MSEAPFDVAIVGYGPVGAMAALQFAHAGLRVTILERSTGVLDLPRAVGLDGESMRALQRLGIAEQVEPILQPPRERDEFCFVDSKRNRLFGTEFPPLGPHGWRDLAFFDQPALEAVLRTAIEKRGDIDVRLGFEVTSFEQEGDRVRIHGRDAEIEASYLIGCDGASSFVRERMGSDWQSLGYDQDWLVIDIELGPEARLPITMMQICDPERLVTYVPCRDPYRRWEFQLLPGETREAMTRPEAIEALLADWLPPDHYRLRRAAVYQFHAATATDWRNDRILIAGDAAHQTPPFLGQGLNSGFRDAVCLGWKLPLVVSGVCDAALLDSYQEERCAHSRDLVDRAVGVGQLMETLAAREAGRPDPHAGAEGRAAPSGGLIPPVRGGTLLPEQIGHVHAIGRMLRQPRVRGENGEAVRLDTLLGDGFAVVARSEADLEMSEPSRAILDRIGARRVALDGLEIVEGERDALFDEHSVAIVRPDRLVFGASDETHDLDALVADLGRRLRLRV